MGLISITNPADTENIDAADVATPFNTIKNEFNGNIDNDNIKAAAAIVASKLSAIGCRVYDANGISITTGVGTALTFDSESFDTNAFHSTSSNTSRITIPTGLGGKYLIIGAVSFAANATGVRQVYLYLNGTTTIAAEQTTNAGASSNSQLHVQTIYSLSAGDYVECFVAQNSGGDLDTVGAVGGDHFEAILIGA